MKKIFLALLTITLLLTGCSKSYDQVNYTSSVTLDSKPVDMSVYSNMDTLNHVFESVSMEEANRMYEEGGTGVVFYGYPGCGFCQRAVSVLNQAASEMGVSIYYVDVSKNDNEAAYDQLIEHVSSVLTEENGEKALYVPQVFVIKDGQVVGNHLSLVDSYVGGSMTDKQTEELITIYKNLFTKLN